MCYQTPNLFPVLPHASVEPRLVFVSTFLPHVEIEVELDSMAVMYNAGYDTQCLLGKQEMANDLSRSEGEFTEHGSERKITEMTVTGGSFG